MEDIENNIGQQHQLPLSIITVNLNNKEGLKNTIDSVAAQTCRNFEFIVVDGNSTDGSRSLLEQSPVPTYYISENDTGVYAAMNKGVNLAHGNYCFFLNSGDTFVNNKVVENVMGYLNDDHDVISGNSYLIGNGVRLNEKSPKELTLPFLLFSTLHHQSTFIKKKLLEETPYDENYHIVSDWKFLIQNFIASGICYRHINLYISNYQLGGISSTNVEKLEHERKAILNALAIDLYDSLKNIPWQIMNVYKEPLPANRRFAIIMGSLNSSLVKFFRRIKK